VKWATLVNAATHGAGGVDKAVRGAGEVDEIMCGAGRGTVEASRPRVARVEARAKASKPHVVWAPTHGRAARVEGIPDRTQGESQDWRVGGEVKIAIPLVDRAVTKEETMSGARR
jgi:hypothetical protein